MAFGILAAALWGVPQSSNAQLCLVVNGTSGNDTIVIDERTDGSDPDVIPGVVTVNSVETRHFHGNFRNCFTVNTFGGDDSVNIIDGPGNDSYQVRTGAGDDTVHIDDGAGTDTYILNGGPQATVDGLGINDTSDDNGAGADFSRITAFEVILNAFQ